MEVVMDFKHHFETSWKLFTANLPALLLNTLALLALSIVSLGIMAPVCTAGYTQSLLELLRGQRKPEIRDLFCRMQLFFPLLGFSILVGIVVLVGFSALVLPGFILVALIFFFCLYLLPLMTDQDLGLVEAVKESYRLALEEPIIDHIVVTVIYIGLISLGSSVFLGTLFTHPFATLFMLSTYEVKRRKLLQAPHASPSSPPPPPPGA
jgi:hypothetical protein